jgi:zinc-ribbon domain
MTSAGDGRCPRCGQQNREQARFCRDCGADLPAHQERPGPSTVTNAELRAGADGRARAPGTAARSEDDRRRLRLRVAVPFTVLLLAGIIAFAGWKARWPAAVFGARHTGATQTLPASTGMPSPRHAPTSGGPSPSPSESSVPATPQPPGPAATVRAYFAAINSRDYAKAWRLGGRNFSSSYTAYVNGFASTVSDSITIISVSGTIVTVQLVALQADGTTKTYQGTYTVTNGVLVASDIQQTG